MSNLSIRTLKKLAHENPNFTQSQGNDLQPIEWGELKPLYSKHKILRPPYPIQAWDNCKLARQAILTIESNTKLPVEMPAQSVLAVLSHVGQGFVNAPMTNGYIPSCIFTLTRAESGDGKSQCIKWAGKGIDEYEKELEQKANEKIRTWHDEIAKRQPDQGKIKL